MTEVSNKFSTKMVAEAGIMLALAQVLSMVELFKMPQGGTITPGSMVPIIMFAVRWGLGPGVLVGVVYGIMQMLLGGYVLVPIQAILDYPLAYGFIGLVGLGHSYYERIAKENDRKAYISIGCLTVLAIFLRMMSHVVSGVVFFYEYAGEMNPWIYSLGYNGSFLAVEALICILLLVLLLKPISKIK